MDWHYTVGTERRGPVDEPTLRGMIASGEIKQDALVWNENLPDWIPAAQIAPMTVATPQAVATTATATTFRRAFFWLLIGRVALSLDLRVAPGLALSRSQFVFFALTVATAVLAWLALKEQRKNPVARVLPCILVPLGLMLFGFVLNLSMRGGLVFVDGIPLWFKLYIAYGYLAIGINLVCAVLGLKQLKK